MSQELNQRRGQQLVETGAAGPGQLQQARCRAPFIPEDLVEPGMVDRNLPSALDAVVHEEAEYAAKLPNDRVEALARLEPGNQMADALMSGRLARNVQMSFPAHDEARA